MAASTAAMSCRSRSGPRKGASRRWLTRSAGSRSARAHDPPPCLLLAAFDTLMLGHRTREPFVADDHDRHILLDRVRVPGLMGREPSPDTSRGRGVVQLLPRR
jgi:hypothetical protein